MTAWTYQCVLGPGSALQSGTVRGEVRIDLDPEGRLPLGPPVLTLWAEGCTLRTSLMLLPENMRNLAHCLLESADKYDELDANYDKDREALAAEETD